jgi:hypothetical protein
MKKDWDSLIKTLKMITKEDFTLSFTVNATPQEAFKSINDVRKWWTENLEGSSEGLNDEFTVRFGDVHASTQKLTEFIPDQKVSWLITDSQLNFIENKQEWNGTTISFEITEDKGQTRIFFTHQGLVPDIECFNACSGAWTDFLENSLKGLIDSGKGQPGKA